MISERQKFIEDDINRTLPLTIDKLDDLRFLASANWLEKNCKEKNN